MPSKPSEEAEAFRIKRKFGKGSELTRVFDEWDEPVRTFLLSQARLEDGELPLLACRQSTSVGVSFVPSQNQGNDEASSWFLLTTRRILWQSPGQILCQARLEDIESVSWSSGPDGWPGRVPSSPPDTMVYTEKGVGHCGFYSPWLAILDFAGQRFEVYLEPGKNLRAIRNLLWQLSGGWRLASERALQANLANQLTDSLVVGSDEYKAMRLEKDFQKHGGIYSENLFRRLAPHTQELLLAEAQLQPEELPVFAFVEDSETWFLATSRRVLWSRTSFKHQLLYGQIRKMGMSELDKVMRQYEASGDWDAWKDKIRVLKSSSPWFYFVDARGIQWDVLLPPGGPLYAIWSAMRFMVQLERIHPCQA